MELKFFDGLDLLMDPLLFSMIQPNGVYAPGEFKKKEYELVKFFIKVYEDGLTERDRTSMALPGENKKTFFEYYNEKILSALYKAIDFHEMYKRSFLISHIQDESMQSEISRSNYDFEYIYENYQSLLPADIVREIQALKKMIFPVKVNNANSVTNKSNVIELIEKNFSVSGSSIENNALHQHQQKLPRQAEHYCLPLDKIKKLYDLFLEKQVIEPIELSDFLKCFDLNNPPLIKPEAIHGKKNIFTYALSKITDINEKLAFSNFGIRHYDQYKIRPLSAGKAETEREINDILLKDVLKLPRK